MTQHPTQDRQSGHKHSEFRGAYTARKGFKKCGICLEMYSDSKSELRDKLEALEYDGYDVFEDVPVIDLVLNLINQEVTSVLEEVKSKQVEIFPCDCQFNKGFAYKKGDPCDGSCVLAPYRERVVSAIDEVEREYRNE